MPIATIDGTALKPGVSRNNRLYTVENIGRAVERAQARIAAATRPVSMRTHHAAGDDSTRLTGHLTALTRETDGRARFAGVIEGNKAGQNIATLADDRDGPPTLRGVSIRGNWIGPVRTVIVDGRACETADDLEIVGLDWTAEPGVDDARVETITFLDDDSATTETAVERHPITESLEEASVTITEANTSTTTAITPGGGGTTTVTTSPAAGPGGMWADHGYHQNQRRFPLNTVGEARQAWFALGETATAEGYAKPQLKRMRGRAKSALAGFGVQVTAEGWLQTRQALAETGTGGSVAEGGWVDGDGSFRVMISNGQVDITVSSWYVDPADLDAIARKAMDGACQALAALDPDADGDVDVPVETAGPAGQPVAETTTTGPTAAPETPAVDTASGTTTTTEEAVMAENDTSTPAADTATVVPGSVTLTGDQFAALLAAIRPAAVAPAESAPVVPAAVAATETVTPVAQPVAQPTAQPVAETQAQMIARLVQEGLAAERATMVQELAQSGALNIGRRGIVAGAGGVVETAAAGVGAEGLPAGLPQKPLHQYGAEERKNFDKYVAGVVLGDGGMIGQAVAATGV